MFKNKNNKQNNLCGKIVKEIRQKKTPTLSQKGLSDLLQLEGLDIDKNAIQRIESGQRFVTDIELKVLSKVLHVSLDDLLKEELIITKEDSH